MNEKILIVDDELDILEMLRSYYLKQEGFRVKTVPGGHEAVLWCAKKNTLEV